MPVTQLPLSIILNVSSGHHDVREVEAAIRTALDAAGRSYRIVVTSDAAEVERAAREAVERSREHPQVIVAAGGDGTLNLVASIVLGSGAVFGVIPLGTFNYFARDLGIPLEPGAAAAALAQGRLMPVHVARVNGHLFLNNASFGLYRRLLEEREGFKQRLGRYRIVAAAAGIATLWRFRDVYTLRMTLDGEAVTLRTPMLFFGLNSLQLENLDLEVAPCAQAGLMAVIALQPSSRWHMIGMALRGMLHGLRGSPDLRCYCASEVEVSVPGRRVTRVAVDGESIECELPLRFEVLRDALPMVVPREPVEVRIAHLSDPHFGTVVPAVREALLGELHGSPPDLIILTGDITQRARRAQFREAAAFLAALPGVPRLCLPGNHDIPLFDVVTRLVSPHRNYRRYIARDLEPAFVDGRVAVLAVDATRRWRHIDGQVDEQQIGRVAARLRRFKQPFRVVCLHQPLAALAAEDRHDVVHGAERALDAWIAAGADLFLGGHIHRPYCMTVQSGDRRDASLLLQAGTCLSHRVRDGIPNSYNMITLRREGGERHIRMERRDHDPRTGGFVVADLHEARSLMDRTRTGLNGWRLAAAPCA